MTALTLAGLLLSAGIAAPAGAEEACGLPGQWVDPAGRTAVQPAELAAAMAKRPVVLLGETHTSGEHHRWQLQALAGLYALEPDMVLGFEAFPRSAQPVLDEWVRGGMGEEAFLEKTRWNEVWRYDASQYMPLFHFARMNRIPMVALNVERSLVERVRKEGWENVPTEAREGVSDPAKPVGPYRDMLAKVFGEHWARMHGGAGHGEKADEADKQPAVEDSEPFARFVAAQLTWDRAMAEALVEARNGGGAPLVVGIIGGGHLENRWGVPHQLADLGIPDAAVLMPWDLGRDCADMVGGFAEAAFVVDAPPEGPKPWKPLLGVLLAKGKDGVRIDKVLDDSVAAAAGLEPGDVITTAAGVAVFEIDALVAIIRRQPPGTWLPLRVRRESGTVDLVARFPVHEP